MSRYTTDPVIIETWAGTGGGQDVKGRGGGGGRRGGMGGGSGS